MCISTENSGNSLPASSREIFLDVVDIYVKDHAEFQPNHPSRSVISALQIPQIDVAYSRKLRQSFAGQTLLFSPAADKRAEFLVNIFLVFLIHHKFYLRRAISKWLSGRAAQRIALLPSVIVHKICVVFNNFICRKFAARRGSFEVCAALCYAKCRHCRSNLTIM